MEWTSARFLTDAAVAPFHSKAAMSEGGSILSKPVRLLIRETTRGIRRSRKQLDSNSAGQGMVHDAATQGRCLSINSSSAIGLQRVDVPIRLIEISRPCRKLWTTPRIRPPPILYLIAGETADVPHFPILLGLGPVSILRPPWGDNEYARAAARPGTIRMRGSNRTGATVRAELANRL